MATRIVDLGTDAEVRRLGAPGGRVRAHPRDAQLQALVTRLDRDGFQVHCTPSATAP